MSDILLVPSAKPAYTPALPAYTAQTVVHPDTFNPVHQTLLDNDAALLVEQEALKQEAQALSGRLDNVEQTSAVDVSRSVELDWLYRGNRIAIEFFNAATTLVAHAGVRVISGIAGDDSLDVESTAGFVLGGDYLLMAPVVSAEEGEESSGTSAELVRIGAILNGTRLRLTRNLSANYDGRATLGGSTLQPRTAGGVRGEVAAQWVTGPINLGESPAQRAVVIRRSVSAGEVRLFYRDAYQVEWAERYWSTRRSAGGAGAEISAGFADYEYVIPMRGDGRLRIEVDGEAVDILHIVAIGNVTGLGGYVNPAMRPSAPEIANPADGAQAVTERPTLSADGYASPAGNGFAAAQFQISTSDSFASVLHDSGEVGSMSYPMPAGVLAANTQFYVRCRVKDVAGLLSDWSPVSSFKTLTTYAYVATPSVIAPTAGQVDMPEQPTLQLGAFAAVGSSDTHAASQWQIRLASGSWTSALHDSGEDAVNKTNYTVPAGVLQAGQAQYVMRARHKGAALGWSEWSNDVAFTTKQQFANILGVMLLAEGGGAGTWSRIDENFNAVTTNAATFANHPVYAGIVDQLIDGQSMVKVPAFYYRSIVVPSGVFAGKRCWQVSDQPVVGFELHPAFKGTAGDLAQFWVGKYQGTADGSTKLGSKAGVTPLVSIDFPTMQARAAARNAGGVSGFQLWDVYQLSAIKLLCLIEMGGADSQALIGQGNVSGSAALAVDHATVAQASWRGFVGLWGNVWQMVDGLKTDASTRYQIWNKDGSRSYVNTGVTAPASGWAASLSAATGVGFDLAGLFLPATTNSPQTNGTLGDYFYSSADRVMYHGGHWSTGANAGLFYVNVSYSASSSTTNIGGRLAKV